MNWEYHEIKPKGILINFIDCIWWENFHEGNENQIQHYIVPDKSIELIFTRSTIKRYTAGEKQLSLNKSQLCGIRTMPQLSILRESPVIGVRFIPKTFYLLCQTEIKNTIDKSLPLSVTFGNSIIDLEQDILLAKSQAQRVQLIEEFFINYIEVSSKVRDIMFEKIIERIESSNGIAPINKISKEYNLSLKSIQRKFVHNLGITPKKYSRLVRFVNHYLKNGSSKRDFGNLSFYDQAHFIKEIKNFTGLSPEKFNSSDLGVQEKIFHKKSY